MIKALTMLSMLVSPIPDMPSQTTMQSHNMSIVQKEDVSTFLIGGEVKIIKMIPADIQKQIELFKVAQEEEAKKRQQEEQARQEELKWHDGVFTAYYPSNNQMEGGNITATGYDLHNSIYYQGYRVIAADPSIPLFSILEIKIGDSTFLAQVLDRGGRIKGNLFDVAHEDSSSSVSFGRQYGKYKIVREGK